MRKILSLLLIGLLSVGSVSANSFPDKPVNIIVPTGPGGGLDLITRTIAEKLNDIWKAGTVVINRPGGNAIVGTQHVLASPPDGYTIIFYSTPTYILAKPSTGFDYDQYLEPLSMTYGPPWVMVTNSKKKVKNLSELAELGKQKGLTYGSTAAGAPLHVYGALATEKMNVKGILVAYKSVPQILVDILNDNLDFAVLNYGTVIQHINAGSMTPLFVFDNKKLSDLPDLPTLRSPGFSEYRNLVPLYNFLVRKDTPKEIKDRLIKDLNQAIKMAMPSLIEKQLVSKSGEVDFDPQHLKLIDNTYEKIANKLAQ